MTNNQALLQNMESPIFEWLFWIAIIVVIMWSIRGSYRSWTKTTMLKEDIAKQQATIDSMP